MRRKRITKKDAARAHRRLRDDNTCVRPSISVPHLHEKLRRLEVETHPAECGRADLSFHVYHAAWEVRHGAMRRTRPVELDVKHSMMDAVKGVV